jgi:hypothetical protein
MAMTLSAMAAARGLGQWNARAHAGTLIPGGFFSLAHLPPPAEK